MFVSYSWRGEGMSVCKLIDAVLETLGAATDRSNGSNGSDESPPPVFCFVDIFCSTQHQSTHAGKTAFQSDLGQLQSIIRAADSTLVYCAPLLRPTALTRCWCLYEVMSAMQHGKTVHVGLSSADRRGLGELLIGSFDTIVTMFTHIDAENADATDPRDKTFIFAEIRKTVQFKGINDMVAARMREWLASVAEDELAKLAAAEAPSSSSTTTEKLEGITTSVPLEELPLRLGFCRLLLQLGRLEQAEGAIAECAKAVENHGGTPMAEALALLGELKSMQGLPQEALSARQQALQLHEAASGPESLAVARALLAVATVLEDDMDDLEGSYPLCAQSVALHEALLPSDHLDLAKAQSALGGLLRMLGRLDEAAPLLERSLAAIRASLPPRHPKVARGAANYAALLQDRGDPGAAVPLFEEALAIEEVVYGPDHVEVASALENLAGAVEDLLEKTDTPPEAAKASKARAVELRRRSLAIYELRLPASHPQLATSLGNLGLLLSRAPSLACEAPALVQRAWAIQEAADPGGLLALNSKGNLGIVTVRAANTAAGGEVKRTNGLALIREALAALKAAPHHLPADDSWCVKFETELLAGRREGGGPAANERP